MCIRDRRSTVLLSRLSAVVLVKWDILGDVYGCLCGVCVCQGGVNKRLGAGGEWGGKTIISKLQVFVLRCRIIPPKNGISDALSTDAVINSNKFVDLTCASSKICVPGDCIV